MRIIRFLVLLNGILLLMSQMPASDECRRACDAELKRCDDRCMPIAADNTHCLRVCKQNADACVAKCTQKREEKSQDKTKRDEKNRSGDRKEPVINDDDEPEEVEEDDLEELDDDEEDDWED